MRGLIFDIQGHSVHDGPGCRTLVFLCGCPLRCRWCSNPEGLLAKPQLLFRERLCQSCPTRCVSVCPRRAITEVRSPKSEVRGPDLDAGGGGRRDAESRPPLVKIDRKRCAGCTNFDCLNVCYRQALQVSAREWTVDALMRLLSRDQPFWGADGGVTFGGGEPLAQKRFLTAVLERCHKLSMHVALETSAAVPTADLLGVLPFVSWLFVDLKHIDQTRHRTGTGSSNDQVLANLSALASAHWPGRLVVRTTIVPGFNDATDDAARAAAFLADRGIREVHLLPFHRLGASKYEQLGQRYAYSEQPAPDDRTLGALANVYRAAGINCHVGGETPF